MPLKHPNKVPKLPKTRIKNPESAKEAIPQKKEDKIEYICFAYFKYDASKNKQYVALRIQTLAEFTSFVYEISLDSRIEKNIIDITLLGLQTKLNFLPSVEPARTEVQFENLIGDYTINVIKQDGSINSAVYNFNIYNKQIKLIKKFLPEKENNRLFCEFDVAEKEFSFPLE